MRRALLPAALVAAALALQGCVPIVIGAGGAAAYTSLEDRRSTGTQIDDESIEVPDDAARAEVEKIVRAVPTVRDVTNDLQVSGISSLGSRANDSYLTSKVRGGLLDTKRVRPVHLKVVTESGVVYLMGVVTEAEADEAVEIARNTGGVRKVVKVFEYCKQSDEACRPPAPKTKAAP